MAKQITLRRVLCELSDLAERQEAQNANAEEHVELVQSELRAESGTLEQAIEVAETKLMQCQQGAIDAQEEGRVREEALKRLFEESEGSEQTWKEQRAELECQLQFALEEVQQKETERDYTLTAMSDRQNELTSSLQQIVDQQTAAGEKTEQVYAVMAQTNAQAQARLSQGAQNKMVEIEQNKKRIEAATQRIEKATSRCGILQQSRQQLQAEIASDLQKEVEITEQAAAGQMPARSPSASPAASPIVQQSPIAEAAPSPSMLSPRSAQIEQEWQALMS